MRTLRFGFLGLTLLALLSGCTFFSKKTALLRFQNGVSLETTVAGCSIINLGGLDRMCDYARSHPADLVFQVGPALTRMDYLFTPLEPNRIFELRNMLWNEWKRQKVAFYSVSYEDLSPSLSALRALTDGSIQLVSSNLKHEDGKWLFSPYFLWEFRGRKIAFLSFSQVAKGPGWVAADLEVAFKEVKAHLPSGVDRYYILSSLPKAELLKLAAFSDKPVLFIGAEIKEPNTERLEALASLVSSGATPAKAPTTAPPVGNSYFIKAADLGRGFGELTLSGDASSQNPENQAVSWGGLFYGYQAYVLNSGPLKHKECGELDPQAQANRCGLKEISKGGVGANAVDGVPCEETKNVHPR